MTPGCIICRLHAHQIWLFCLTSVLSFTPMRCGRHSFCVMQDASSQFLTIFCSAVLQSQGTPSRSAWQNAGSLLHTCTLGLLVAHKHLRLTHAALCKHQ